MKFFKFLFLSIILCFFSCKKKGCTDLRAANYDEEAEKPNGSCIYNVDMTFYLTEEYYLMCKDSGITALSFTVEHENSDTVLTTPLTSVDSIYLKRELCYGNPTFLTLTGQEQSVVEITYTVKNENEEILQQDQRDVGGVCGQIGIGL